jgi:hypothetical protein
MGSSVFLAYISSLARECLPVARLWRSFHFEGAGKLVSSGYMQVMVAVLESLTRDIGYAHPMGCSGAFEG